MQALLNELLKAQMTEGAIFRRVQGDYLTEPLSDRAVFGILNRALIALRAQIVEPVLQIATANPDRGIHEHALATVRLLHDPDADFESAVEEAKRIFALGKE